MGPTPRKSGSPSRGRASAPGSPRPSSPESKSPDSKSPSNDAKSPGRKVQRTDNSNFTNHKNQNDNSSALLASNNSTGARTRTSSGDVTSSKSPPGKDKDGGGKDNDNKDKDVGKEKKSDLKSEKSKGESKRSSFLSVDFVPSKGTGKGSTGPNAPVGGSSPRLKANASSGQNTPRKSPRNSTGESLLNNKGDKTTTSTRESIGFGAIPFTTQVGMWSLQGKRDANEDAHLHIEDFITEEMPCLNLKATKQHPAKLYGVFDGHGGNECAKFIAKNLPTKLKHYLGVLNKRTKVDNMSGGQKLALCFILAFEMLDIEYLSQHIGSEAGCTAVVCLVDTISKQVICSNIGDSRACIGRSKSSMALTRDQDPTNPIELARVKGSWGGQIDAEGYVNQTVNMTRCLGDRGGKFHEEDGFFSRSYALASAPEVKTVQLKENHQFLLLACDGLFEPNVFTTTSICTRCRELLADNKNAKEIAQTICREAIKMGSGDNVSVLMVLFKPGETV